MQVLFGPPELFGRSQNVGKLAGIRPEPNAKPVFGAALMPSLSTGVSRCKECCTFSLQCCDTIGWVTGKGIWFEKVGCWFVGGNDLTGALHVL